MSETAAQDVTPERFGAYVAFGDKEKQLIEDAGQALIRGEVNAADSLVAAAMPLCVIVTGTFVKPYKRFWDWRHGLRKQAREALAKAVASLDRRFRDGSLKALKSTFRAYLSKCIRCHLIRYSRRSDKAARGERTKTFDIADSGLDWLEILSLTAMEKKVYVDRERGKKWKQIAASIKRTPRQAQRIFKRVKEKAAA